MKIKFGTDGWRSIIDQDFNDENVAKISQAVAEYLRGKDNPSVVIGYDMRKKADYFSKLCAEIMAGNNIKVYLVNKPCPTPTAGYSIVDKKANGGVMFTASHNPAEFLGFKYMTEKAETAPSNVTDVFQNNLERIKNLSQIKKIDFKTAQEEKKIEVFDPVPAYDKKLQGLIDINKIKTSGLKILFNPMYGSGQGFLTRLLAGGKTNVTEINNKHDINFGGTNPEPIVEKNITDQINMMKNGNYDIGIAFDGDADRVGLIDEKGNFISSLKTFLLISYYFWVIKNNKLPIVRTQTNTVMVDHLANKLQRTIYEVSVGFKYCAAKMAETSAVLGGEESGGSGFSTHIPARDACAYTLYLLDLFVILKKPVSEILKMVQEESGGSYEFKRIDKKFSVNGYDELKEKTTDELTKNPPQEVAGKKVVRTRVEDGLKFYFEDDAWLLIRFSGTEPKLRLYAEAKTTNEVENLLQAAEKIIEKYK